MIGALDRFHGGIIARSSTPLVGLSWGVAPMGAAARHT